MTEKSNALARAQLLMLHADTIENDSIKNMVIDSATELAVLHDEIERLMTRLVEAKDKALRYDLDAAGISNREKEALELVELRAENERLREALAWAYNLRHLRGHSDPVVIPERFAPFIEAALQEVP